MIKRYGMFFRAIDPAGGGGAAAVAEPPEPGMTPVGEAYEAALAKERGESAAQPDAAAAAKKAEAKATADKTAGDKEAAAAAKPPETALEAALETAPASDKKDEKPVESLLKDLPETLPSEKRGDHWSKARGAISTLEATVAEKNKAIADLTKQVSTSKTAPPETVQQLEEAKTQLARYKDAIVALNVEYDPEFRAKFVDGRAALVTKAASKLSAYGGNGDALKTALELPEGRSRNAAIKEAMGDLEVSEQTRVMQFVADIEKLDDERADIQKDPQGAWDKLQKTQGELRAKDNERVEAYKKTVFEDTAAKLTEKIVVLRPVADTVANATDWNKDVADIKDSAFKLLGADTTPEQLAEAAIWAKAGPKLQMLFLESRKELKTALARIAEYEAAEPGFRGGKGPKKDALEELLEKTPGQIFTAARAAEEK